MSAPNQLSFLPDDYLERKAQRRANVICATLFVIVVGAIGSAFKLAEDSLKDVERRHADVETQYADAAKRIEQVQQMQEKQRTMARQAELTAQLLERVPRSFVLAEVTNALPEGVSLIDLALDSKVRRPVSVPNPSANTSFEQRRQAAAAAAGQKAQQPEQQAVQYDVTIKVVGMAYTDVQVAKFIANLNRSDMLQDVNLVVTDQFNPDSKQRDPNKDDPGADMRKFEITLSLRPDAEVKPGQQPNRGRSSGTAQVSDAR
jgi:Tfp pilus assembly protein PilN